MRGISGYRTYALGAVVALAFATPAGARADERAELKFTVVLTAKVDGGQFVGVAFTGLDKVTFLPGDEVKITFEGNAEFDAEFWSRRYTWQKTEKRGKKKIITTTTKDAEVTWRAKWGAGIDGVFAFANGPAKEDVVKLPVSKLANAKPVKIVHKVEAVKLEFTVQPDPNRIVDRPADVPANAENLTVTPRQELPPKIDALISNGADLGKLVVTVKRPSGK